MVTFYTAIAQHHSRRWMRCHQSINPSSLYLSITSPLSSSITYLAISIIYHTGSQSHKDLILSDSMCMGCAEQGSLETESGLVVAQGWREECGGNGEWVLLHTHKHVLLQNLILVMVTQSCEYTQNTKLYTADRWTTRGLGELTLCAAKNLHIIYSKPSVSSVPTNRGSCSTCTRVDQIAPQIITDQISNSSSLKVN